jgi:hypothetical protein
MSALRPEPAHVQLNDGRPTRFVWRGRLYTVLSIVARPDGDPCWHVTASPGRQVPAVAFMLCYDPAADGWLLSRDAS